MRFKNNNYRDAFWVTMAALLLVTIGNIIFQRYATSGVLF